MTSNRIQALGPGTARSQPLNRLGEGTATWVRVIGRGELFGVLTPFRVPLSFQKINRTPSDEECFFDLLSKFQSNRMDDQRCPLEECPAEAAQAAATPVPALGERLRKHPAVPAWLWEQCCRGPLCLGFAMCTPQAQQLFGTLWCHPRQKEAFLW